MALKLLQWHQSSGTMKISYQQITDQYQGSLAFLNSYNTYLIVHMGVVQKTQHFLRLRKCMYMDL